MISNLISQLKILDDIALFDETVGGNIVYAEKPYGAITGTITGIIDNQIKVQREVIDWINGVPNGRHYEHFIIDAAKIEELVNTNRCSIYAKRYKGNRFKDQFEIK